MTDLADFLLARIAEVEGLARAAKHGGPWEAGSMRDRPVVRQPDDMLSSGAYAAIGATLGASGMAHRVADCRADSDAAHIAHHDPARVLAECEGKRRIVELHAIECYPDDDGDWYCCDGCSTPMVPHSSEVACPTLKALALSYADHPGYRAEWKP